MLITIATSQESFLLDQSNFEAVVVFLSNPQQFGQASLSGAHCDTLIGISSVTNKQTVSGLSIPHVSKCPWLETSLSRLLLPSHHLLAI